MIETARTGEAAQGSKSGLAGRGAHVLVALVAVLVFAGAVWVIGYFGWFVVRSVWSDDPDPPSVAFAAGVALCVVGCLAVATSSLVAVLWRLEVLGADRGFARAARRSWAAGALCAVAGLAVLVGLGVVMTAVSQLSPYAKAVVIAVFALCALIPIAPGYEIWRRRAGAKTD
ncbi:MAG: glycoprotein [Segniliparus sp.]|uniref:glycoprotein n=1 Tax=Segniliparus sp. TaxID=2804064 RepID=UPI003F319E38